VNDKGWGELETTDWENYYSLPILPPSPASTEGFERRVMLIALLPPAGNMYSRNARNIRTKTTCERPYIRAAIPLVGKVTLPGQTSRTKWTKLTRDGNIARRWIDTCVMIFRWVAGAICMVIFRDYAPSNFRRFVDIGSVRSCERDRATKSDSDSSEAKMLILLFASVYRYFRAIFSRNFILFFGNAYLN